MSHGILARSSHILPLALLLSLGSQLVSAQTSAIVGTFVVRPASGEVAASLSSAKSLGALERYCQGTLCVVLPQTAAERSGLSQLAEAGIIEFEGLPDAHKLFFAKATYDADTDSFDTDFPGSTEFATASAMGQWSVIFKASPDPSWRKTIEALGFYLGEPLGSMAYQLYGPRDSIARLRANAPFIAAIAEVPLGVKRFNLDSPEPGDEGGGPVPTTVVIFAIPDSPAHDALLTQYGREPAVAFKTGATIGYDVVLTRQEALYLNSFPDVITVRREPSLGGPSDERSNRLMAGDYQNPGSSYPLTLGTNGTNYWSNYINSLSNAGFFPLGSVIGFLDTGVNVAPMQTCPPALYIASPPACFLPANGVTDVTTNFTNPALRANDNYGHGTVTTAIAAGFNLNVGDAQGYSFAEGVAPYTLIAMSKIWNLCPDNGETWRTDFVNDLGFDDPDRKTRYSLVELSQPTTTILPDGVRGSNATIFNHSWNMGTSATQYSAIDILFDQTARTLQSAFFDFSTTGVPNVWYGVTGPAIHVVAAGNNATPGPVQSPGIAKNVITVGASETYNPYAYGAPVPTGASACAPNFATTDSDNPRQVASFSGYGYPNLRLKPDFVAPGTRVAAPESPTYNPYYIPPPPAVNCSECGQLAQTGTPPYYLNSGTSYSTPAVSGAVVLLRSWLASAAIGKPNASPALIRAGLVIGAHNLVAYRTAWGTCWDESGQHYWSCGDMRPAPDQYAGWGGAALDQYFRAATNYYFFDQGTVLTQGLTWTKTLTITDSSKPVKIALVWTDRAAPLTLNPGVNLINDLDVKVQAKGSDQIQHTWYGNLMYYNKDDLSRTEYSLRDPSPITYDRKNNQEKVAILQVGQPSGLPVGATTITVTVTGFSIVDDGLEPHGSTHRQDFALAVLNAHQ